MSTLRVSNIEAKADASSPTIDEKVKVTSSQGRVLVQIDGKTAGITSIGINTTSTSFTIDGNQNVQFVGIITAANVNTTGVSTFTRINVGSSGTVFTTSSNNFIGIGTTNPQGRLHLSTPAGSDAVLVLDDVNRNAVVYAPGTTGSQGQFVFRRGLPSSYTDQLIIYEDGNATKPLQSFCDTGATNSWGAAGSLAASPASAKGNWSSTTANVGNNFSTTTDLYTCPRTGVYAISCTCSMANVSGRTIFVLSINGGYEEITEINDFYEDQSPCVLRKLNTNDTIGLGINGTGGSNYTVRLQVYFLG